MSAVVTMPEADFRAMLVGKLEALEQSVTNRKTDAILTREEAVVYVKAINERAFDAWRAKWHVKPCGYRRYSRNTLDLGLAREAGVVRVPASMRRAS